MRSTEDPAQAPPTGGERRPADGERRLIAAIIVRAVEESLAGDAEAADWLATTGSNWCDWFLGLLVPPDAWAHIDLKAARRLVSTKERAARLARERIWRIPLSERGLGKEPSQRPRKRKRPAA